MPSGRRRDRWLGYRQAHRAVWQRQHPASRRLCAFHEGCLQKRRINLILCFFVTKDPLSRQRGSSYFCQFAFCRIVLSFFVYFDYRFFASLLFLRISVQNICNYTNFALQYCVFLMYNNSVWMTLFVRQEALCSASCSAQKRHPLTFVIFNYLKELIHCAKKTEDHRDRPS